MDWGMPDLRVRGFAGVRSGELCFEERGSQEAGQTTQVGSREGGSTRGRKDRRCDDHLRNGECILVFHTKDLERRYHKDPTANLSPNDLTPTMVKRQREMKKLMYAVFFRSTGFIKAIKLEGQKTVTANWYTTKCLPEIFQ
ncbi:uncharacterized protein TNCV_4031111 [Trichonephila clavipes]|nr:uncharacterized protein TNCV_4031111 [Trichonephila clavipes]